MSSLIVSHDLHLMMLEFSVEKLFVPKKKFYEQAVMQKTVVMFRMLDDEWTSLQPNRHDYRPYRGSNYEEEPFYGGKSIVFAIPEASLERPMGDVDVQVHVRRETSKFFEMDTCRTIGITCANAKDLFNGIIEDIEERRELIKLKRLVHAREPISRVLKATYKLLDEEGQDTGANMVIYLRLSYFGKSIITEFDVPESVDKVFYVKEETHKKHPYQCKEVSLEKVTTGCWGSATLMPPLDQKDLKCICAEGDSKLVPRVEPAREDKKNGTAEKDDEPKDGQSDEELPKDDRHTKDQDKDKLQEKDKAKEKEEPKKDDKLGKEDKAKEDRPKDKDKSDEKATAIDDSDKVDIDKEKGGKGDQVKKPRKRKGAGNITVGLTEKKTCPVPESPPCPPCLPCPPCSCYPPQPCYSSYPSAPPCATFHQSMSCYNNCSNPPEPHCY